MDRQQILLGKSLEAAGVDLTVQSFEDRLILQKAVYLLQTSGIHMGFRFRWYLRGPYSSDMTSSAYGILNEGELGKNELKTWDLDNTSVEIATKIKPLLHIKNENKKDKAKRLELLASILFLFKTDQAKPSNCKETSLILQNNGKDYTEKQVSDAVKDLKKYDLIK